MPTTDFTGFAIWGDDKRKPRICFLFCVCAKIWDTFSASSQRNTKGQKDNRLCLVVLVVELQGLMQQDGSWKAAPEIYLWFLRDSIDIRLLAHALSPPWQDWPKCQFFMQANRQKRAGKGKGQDREMCWRKREGEDLAAAGVHKRIFMRVV